MKKAMTELPFLVARGGSWWAIPSLPRKEADMFFDKLIGSSQTNPSDLPKNWILPSLRRFLKQVEQVKGKEEAQRLRPLLICLSNATLFVGLKGLAELPDSELRQVWRKALESFSDEMLDNLLALQKKDPQLFRDLLVFLKSWDGISYKPMMEFLDFQVSNHAREIPWSGDN